MGRPTKLTQELATKLFERLAEGEPIRAICKEYDFSVQTLYNWIDSSPAFLEQYARAKERAMDKMADEILTICDDNSRDEKIITGFDGNPITVIDNEYVQRSRLRVDTRKWLMSKLAPKKYSEKNRTELTGADGKDLSPLVAVIQEVANPKKSTDK